MPASRPGSPAGAIAFAVAVIAATVYVAGLLPSQERQLPVTESEQQQFEQQRAATNDRLQDMISERLSVSQLAEEREREASRLGQELALRCLQWTDLHDSQPSAETEKFQEHACRRYNHYVTTGELLDPLPDPEVDLL